VRSAYEDHLVTVQHDDAGWRAVLVNDGSDTWAAAGTIALRALNGDVLWSQGLDETLAPRSLKNVPLAGLPVDRTDVAIVVTAEGAERAVRLLAEDVALPLPEAQFETSVARTDEGVAVTVTARSFLRSLCLFPDRVSEDVWTDSLLVDLFPGDAHTFIIAGNLPEDATAGLTSRPVLRSVTKPLTPSEAE
jgi:beta-mannosidase